MKEQLQGTSGSDADERDISHCLIPFCMNAKQVPPNLAGAHVDATFVALLSLLYRVVTP